MTNQIGKKIKHLREELNMNQSAFSNYIDVTQASLSTYENGNRLPSLDVLMRIADKCNVTLDWLCSRESGRHFMTVADVIMVLKELKDLNGFEYDLNVNKIDLATCYSYECTVKFNSDVKKIWNVDDDVLSHILEFINDWKETTDDLNNLKNDEIKKNYKQMWWEKQIAHYSTIPVKTKKEANEEYTQDILDNFASQGLLGKLKSGDK